MTDKASLIRRVSQLRHLRERIHVLLSTRPRKLDKTGCIVAATYLLEPVDEGLYTFKAIADLAQLLHECADVTEKAITTKFATEHWAWAACKYGDAVDRAKEKALEEMERRWVRTTMLKALRGPGDTVTVRSRDLDLEWRNLSDNCTGTVTAVDELRALYTVKDLKGKGNKVVIDFVELPVEKVDIGDDSHRNTLHRKLWELDKQLARALRELEALEEGAESSKAGNQAAEAGHPH